jgi:hypothetical protein
MAQGILGLPENVCVMSIEHIAALAETETKRDA